ncbi:MAG: glycosyltransferase [Pseudomonadota bacterium]
MNSERPLDVCLVMIVRNEAHVIQRCLDSVRSLITRWCIVDTGSSDDTAQLIQETLKDLPGELHHRPWVDFGHNRSESLALARDQGDWLLLIDADEELVISEDFTPPSDSRIHAWQIKQKPGGETEFYLPRLLRSDHPWRFEAVLHEYLASDRPFEQARLQGLTQIGHFDSARNQQSPEEKYRRDAQLLAYTIEKHGDDPRYQFYLAQSLRDAGQLEESLSAYRKRARMAGWDEEVYCSLFEVARLLERLRASSSDIVQAYLEAWNARPTRAEPLSELARVHRLAEQHAAAHLFAERACQISQPDDSLFLDPSVYQWRAKDELAIASYWMGDRQTAIHLTQALLDSGRLPASEEPRIRSNLDLYQQRSDR